MKILNDKAIIIGFEKIDFDRFPNLKVIGCNATSTEHIDEECEKRKIKVISLKGETKFLQKIISTAEHTIGLILALMRNYKSAFKNPYQDRDFYIGNVLKEKTLGIIGYGRVGKQVMEIAKIFRMKVIYFDKDISYPDYSSSHNLEGLLEKSDIVSLHIPLQNNEGFFTKTMFQKMKPTSYLINTSRSSIIEKGALIWALKNSIIKGAAIDFIDDFELIKYAKNHNNLILTNHMGGCTEEDMEKTQNFIEKKVAEEIKNYEIKP